MRRRVGPAACGLPQLPPPPEWVYYRYCSSWDPALAQQLMVRGGVTRVMLVMMLMLHGLVRPLLLQLLHLMQLLQLM
jgi:hypothetical protein